MHLTKNAVSATTTDQYTAVRNGVINSIQYVKAASGSFSSTATVAITTADSSITIFSSAIGASSFTKAPRYTCVDSTGVAITNSYGKIAVSEERLKIAIAATSATGQTGTFNIYIEGA